MGYFLGGAIVFYMIYLICALIFKHQIGFIIATFLSVIMSIGIMIGSGNVFSLISMIIVAVIVWFVMPLHIRDENKNATNSEDESDENSGE